MRRFMFLVLVMCMPAPLLAQYQHPDREWLHNLSRDLKTKRSALLRLHTDADGTRQIYVATKEQIAKCPKWDGKAEPPLSLTKAIGLARTHLKKNHPKYEDFPLTSAGVNLIQYEGVENKWFYDFNFMVKFKTPGRRISDILEIEEGWSSESFSVYMMMDGTILKPQVVKE